MKKYLKFNTPAHDEAKILASDFDLKNHGLHHLDRVYWNLPESALYEEIVFRNEGKIAHQGPVIVNTGEHTARAAADKYIVNEHITAKLNPATNSSLIFSFFSLNLTFVAIPVSLHIGGGVVITGIVGIGIFNGTGVGKDFIIDLHVVVSH